MHACRGTYMQTAGQQLAARWDLIGGGCHKCHREEMCGCELSSSDAPIIATGGERAVQGLETRQQCKAMRVPRSLSPHDNRPTFSYGPDDVGLLWMRQKR